MNIWNVTGTNVGTFTGSYGTVEFSGREPDRRLRHRLVPGRQRGERHRDRERPRRVHAVNYSAYTGPVTVNVSKLADIRRVGGSAADTLGDLTYFNTWTVTGTDAGTFASLFWYGPLISPRSRT